MNSVPVQTPIIIILFLKPFSIISRTAFISCPQLNLQNQNPKVPNKFYRQCHLKAFNSNRLVKVMQGLDLLLIDQTNATVFFKISKKLECF